MNYAKTQCMGNLITANFVTNLKAYAANYESITYSWRTCNFFTYPMTYSTTCTVTNVVFDSSDCPATMGSGCTNDCTGAATINFFVNGYNQYMNWYTTNQPFQICSQFEFQASIMNALFYDSTYAPGWQSTYAAGGYLRQYMFC